MAKVLLKTEMANCNNFAVEEGSSVAVGCILEPIIRGIINTQNHQIQTMEALLERFKVPLVSDCDDGKKVPVKDESGVGIASNTHFVLAALAAGIALRWLL